MDLSSDHPFQILVFSDQLSVSGLADLSCSSRVHGSTLPGSGMGETPGRSESHNELGSLLSYAGSLSMTGGFVADQSTSTILKDFLSCFFISG